MKVKANTGEMVDFGQPENVRRGMVFASGSDEQYIAGRMVRDRAWARADTNGDCDRADLTLWKLLGCDPAHAARADCERFGIAPGIDAAAHGFARTWDGFAVDLRRHATVGIGEHDTREDIAREGRAMMCPKHGPMVIGPRCGRCVGEEFRREVAELNTHLRRVAAPICPECTFGFGKHARDCKAASGDSGAGQPPSAHPKEDQ